ncbi:VWA domain-containing protein [Agreia sp. PsM10]|uniref:VWA domain-containing protein n=1 Tax=Agreia sp. PsM10 TaxID=3030533 RepID=UPI00263BAFE6|nr:VWA domain-containing protein [Agreia sp. PsM10]MDN4639355.1 VWA domain-containing protein [Agreia sp. PsM10]
MTPLFGAREHPLDEAQRAAWQSAQALWGVRLHDPLLEPGAARSSFAWFSFPPQVSVDPTEARRHGVDGFYESIFAHEIGHHVLSPSTRIDSFTITQQLARAIAATGRARIPDPDGQAHRMSNLWSDMLINTRVATMQRQRDGATSGDPQMITMWRALSVSPPSDQLWWVVLRAYEILWSRPAGFLCPAEPPPRPVVHRQPPPPTVPAATKTEEQRLKAVEAAAAADARIAAEARWAELVLTNPPLDAALLAETVRTFGDDPVSGALRFGMIMAPYLISDGEPRRRSTAAGAQAAGGCAGQADETAPTAAELERVLGDPRLREVPEHPAVEKARQAASASGTGMEANDESADDASVDGLGQGYGLADTLALYSAANADDVVAAWYLTAARRYVRPLTQPPSTPRSLDETIPGALEQWNIDDDISAIDWPASLSHSTTVVPGVTTRLRDVLPDAPPDARESVQLDIYIDSSGSMTAPRRESPGVLAGTILILSALRGGGQARVTSFSAAGEVAGGARFTRDRAELMRDLTFYFGHGTTFPLDLYATRYADARRSRGAGASVKRRHVVVLSDDGLQSMFGAGQPQYADVARTVRRTLDTATLVVQDAGRRLTEPATEAGYDVEYIDRMTDAPLVCARLARRLAEPPGLRRTEAGGRRG